MIFPRAYNRFASGISRMRVRIAANISNYYEAARASKMRSTISAPARDAKSDITGVARREVLKKVRYLYRNSPFIHGLVERLVTYVVGTGIMPVPATSDEAWNARANEGWRMWSIGPDLQSRLDFVQLQQIIYRAILLDGDIFTLLTYGRSGRPRLQLIEGHLVGDGTLSWSSDEPDGVILDSIGRPTHFTVATDDESTHAPTPIPAENIIQHWLPERARQYRGMSILAAAVNTAHDVDDILGLEKAAVKDGSSKTDIIKTASGELNNEGLRKTRFSLTNTDATTVTRDQYYQDVFGPEAKVLQKGDEFTPYASNRPSQTWQGFMDFLAQTICMSTGVPPSLILQMKVGGADTRRDMAAAQRVFELHQWSLATQFQRVFDYVIQSEIDRGFLSDNPEKHMVSWQFPKAVTVDYGRESKEDREDVKMALLSLREYYGRYGMDWKKELMQIAEEQAFVQKLAEEHGLKPEDLMLKNPKMLKPENENMVQD